ncbi:RNA polymerase sigma factor [Brevundimonas sp.]
MRKLLDDPQDDTTSALRELYVRYSDWLKAYVSRRYGDQEAEDLAQETWLRLVPTSAVGEIRYPKALLLKIASNIAIDRAARKITADRGLAGLSDWNVQFAAQLDEITLGEIVLGLPQPLRDVFVLSRFGGLTNVEIAEKLGISPKTVEWRMTKALAHCAAELRR